MRPVTLTTWGDWRASHPDTLALDINTGFPRNYSSEGAPGAAYVDYFSSPDLWFPVNVYDERLQVKDVVYGIEIGGSAKAYPVDTVGEEGLVNDEVGGTNLVLIGNPGTKAVEVFERGGLEFVGLLTENGVTTLTDADGVEWRVKDERLEALDGSGEAVGAGVGEDEFLVRVAGVLSRRRRCMGSRGFPQPHRGGQARDLPLRGRDCAAGHQPRVR